jgi:hypothetical protein
VKYDLPFKPRQGMSHTEVIEGARCALEICELGTAERVNIVQFVQAIDSTSGGGIVFETHNLEALYEDAVVLGAFNENQLHPVLDIENTVAYEQRALARWGSQAPDSVSQPKGKREPSRASVRLTVFGNGSNGPSVGCVAWGKTGA